MAAMVEVVCKSRRSVEAFDKENRATALVQDTFVEGKHKVVLVASDSSLHL